MKAKVFSAYTYMKTKLFTASIFFTLAVVLIGGITYIQLPCPVCDGKGIVTGVGDLRVNDVDYELEELLKKSKESEPVETFGFEGALEPDPVKVDLEGMIQHFKTGFQQFSPLWKEIFCKRCFEEIQGTAQMDAKDFHLSTTVWAQIIYELAATFHTWSVNRNKLVDLVTPLYYARVASFVKQSWEMSSAEAEALVEDQAMKFEEQKDYLIKVWEEKSREITKT